jgi:hypothetical protein
MPAAALACLLLLAPTAGALAVNPLFAEVAPLELTLSGPFNQIDEDRDKDQEYEGTVTYTGDAGPVTLDVKYSVRGHFRLQTRICHYAQLWLDFDKDELEGTVFAGQNRLKLAVQCRDGDRYAAYLAHEEQIYRMFALLSDISLSTRLVRVTYVDPAGGEARTHLGFLLQHHKRLAQEKGLELLEVPHLSSADLDPAQSSLVSLFMYMIANTDYSMIAGKANDECCHNTKPLADADGVVFPLPYDFDSTGYVDASYAEISAGIGQTDIQERIYRGFCVPQGIMDSNLQKFRGNRDAILAIAGEEIHVSRGKAKKAVKFLEKFYKVIDSDFKLKVEILNACR